MHVITRRRLREFWEQHPEARTPLATWYGLVRRARYAGPAEVERDFASASVLGAYRTVFNIAGNTYRLVVDMRDDLRRVYIRDVLTHREYTRRSKAGTL